MSDMAGYFDDDGMTIANHCNDYFITIVLQLSFQSECNGEIYGNCNNNIIAKLH